MNSINDEIKAMLKEGRSEGEIIGYLMTVHGISTTLALTMVKRAKTSIANENAPQTSSKAKDFSLTIFTILIIAAIIVGIGYFMWERIAMIIEALTL